MLPHNNDSLAAINKMVIEQCNQVVNDAILLYNQTQQSYEYRAKKFRILNARIDTIKKITDDLAKEINDNEAKTIADKACEKVFQYAEMNELAINTRTRKIPIIGI